MIDVAIVGASGYGGGELLRWLSVHPEAKIKIATSNTYADKPVSASFPGLAGRLDLTFTGENDPAELGKCDVVFLARDNGVAMKVAPALLEAGAKVIDLSADFRFRNPADHHVWYNMEHCSPTLCGTAVYGLPELHKAGISRATLVGNPGCFTTSSILALAPLVSNNLIDSSSIIVDGKSGVSGAGRSKFGLDYHFSEANESVSAYKVAGTHRHTGEIEQELSLLAGRDVRVSFTPHLVPMTRGILATCYGNLATEISQSEILSAYREFYSGAPFVHITDGLPATKHTVGSNMCHIGLAIDKRTNRVTVVSCIDNLGKGMVGQAIQNMNLMFGFKETAGLQMPAMWP
jgi:N-acetyl-gamma-glutamyl-phosphate reductase